MSAVRGAVDGEVALHSFVPCHQAVCVIDRVGLGGGVVVIAQILGCAFFAAAVVPFADFTACQRQAVAFTLTV